MQSGCDRSHERVSHSGTGPMRQNQASNGPVGDQQQRGDSLAGVVDPDLKLFWRLRFDAHVTGQVGFSVVYAAAQV
jgi:hypothetical protein